MEGKCGIIGLFNELLCLGCLDLYLELHKLRMLASVQAGSASKFFGSNRSNWRAQKKIGKTKNYESLPFLFMI